MEDSIFLKALFFFFAVVLTFTVIVIIVVLMDWKKYIRGKRKCIQK